MQSIDLSLDDAAKLLGIPELDLTEWLCDRMSSTFHAAYKSAIDEGETEAKATEFAESEQDKYWEDLEAEYAGNYACAIESILEKTAEAHRMSVVLKNGIFKLTPIDSWRKVAEEFRVTIEGEGLFGFTDIEDFIGSGPYPDEFETVKSHLHYLNTWFEVYGERSPLSTFERAMR